jgi:glycosyltransferase involved in cell wall biosynthesis
MISVTVCVFTYNYELYIEQCINSIINQNTNFKFEILISDDFSTDNTRNICLHLKEKNPSLIKLNFNDYNIGGTSNWIKGINLSKGKYISLIDGDDYFTDSFKLQKQFDALENEISAVLCFHSVEEKYFENKLLDKVISFENDIYTIEDFMRNGWFVRTSSIFFRNNILPSKYPDWVYNFPYRFDTILIVFLTLNGNAINLKESMSVWRKHIGGLSNNFNKNRIENSLCEINLAAQLNSYTIYKYDKIVKSYISEIRTNLFILLLKDYSFFNNLNLISSLIFNLNYKLLLYKFKSKYFGNS